MNTKDKKLIGFPYAEGYISPQYRVIKFKIEGILCLSLGDGENIGGWNPGEGSGGDLDSDW